MDTGSPTVVSAGHEKIRTNFYAKCSMSKHKVPILFRKLLDFECIVLNYAHLDIKACS